MSRLFRRGHTADSSNHQPGSGLHRKRAPTLPSTPAPTSPQSSKTDLSLSTDSAARRSPSLSASPASHTTARERFPDGAEHQSLDVSLSDAPGSKARKGSSSSSAPGPPSPRSMSSTGLRDSGDETETDEYEVGKKSTNNSGKRAEILAKRFGEENPFVLPHDATSQMYPGVVIGSFAAGDEGNTFAGGVGFDGSMDDIMDTSATPQAITRQGSTSGQAGANIAPWLSDDTPAPGLNHHTSVPALPKLHREESSRSRNGSHPSISSAHQAQDADPAARSRMASQESITMLGKMAPTDPSIPLPGGGRHHPSGRASRYGSTVSNISAGGSIASDKKKGFLGGLLKRKTGQSVSQAPSDFVPADEGHRGSGSTSSRLSSSTSYSSLSNRQPIDDLPGRLGSIMPRQSYVSDALISPLHEIAEPEFTLDMNLDDMEGIVDTNMANATPAPASRPSQAPTAASSIVLQDALGSFASSSQSGSGDSGASGPSRAVVSPADRETFTRPNPFGESGQGSNDGKARTPPSPHTLTLSPKHFLPPGTQPRRPSQLRNVKMGSVDSDSSVPDSIQPLSPAWAAGSPGVTLFHDPFGSSAAASQRPKEGLSPLRANDPADQATASNAALAAAAAWAAPESWGVEGDDEPEDATSSDEDDWAQAEEMASVPSIDQNLLQPSISGSSRKPPPFGHKSMGSNGPRPGSSTARKNRTRTANGRPNSATRPSTATRPGTSGSTNVSTSPHYIRIYRADGSYNIMDFPLNATTTEIINVLSSAGDGGKKASTNMRLYLRAGGQDRQLLPSEKPLTIQDRRLRQAGYTEAENLEDLGKEDLFVLFKLIFQTPNLPVMNPEEESTYDSFEFIDVAARDLLTIPIFLHLHAHNIIILNVSKNPMSDIPLDFIQACTSLKELRMSYMALKRIPTSICASTTLSRLDVSCNRIADLENVPLHEIQTLLSLKVQNNKLTSIPAYFSQMKALKYLNISNNKFETFPAIVSEMSNLVDLDVSFNDIAELPSEMSNLKSLERLAAFGNELVTFPASFSTLANLRALDVRRNKLTDLNSVYALPNLTTLQADNNNLVTLDAQLGAKVRQFSVPHNSITRFTLAPQLNVAAVTYSLTRLDLSHGKISTLADEAFSGLVNLIELNLSFNQFTRLPSTIGDLINLQVMLLTDNMLETLPPMGRLQKLRVLNIHNNNLTSFPGSMWACGSLEHLNASSNLIKDIPPPPPLEDIIGWVGEERADELGLRNSNGSSLLPISISLKWLQMADNRFTDDIFHYISDSRNLRTLNLSFNDIFEIPAGTLSRFDKLEQLYLSGNKLTTLPAEDLEKLQQLKVLHLNGNKLQTLPSELGALGALQHLDVGSNVLKYNIANWPYDWNWNWNTALKYLNLSGNKRLEIKPTSAQDMSHASSFRKDLSDFTALTQLRVLGLMDVTLRIPSLPDESDEKRVRTSFSDINNMAYGISDMVGSQEHLAMFDLVVPNFRGKDNECLFGMFGRAMTSAPAGKIPKYLQESFGMTLNTQLDRLGEGEAVTEALRRTFLSANRATFQHLMGSSNGRKQSVTSVSSVDSMFRNWSPSPTSQFRQGCSGAVVYLVDKTLHVGNVGDCLVVISRKGEAELLSKYHDPTDREETARIRKAEAWVSTKGYVNDEKDIDISRAMGYFHHHPAVNASPEIRTRELSESDEFVIIGNHALWKCCSYQTAVDIARTERDDPMMAAQKLRDFAISYGAEGSVMVMVVNVSDVFYSRSQRPRGASGPAPADEGFSARDKRNIRRRYEEVGDRTLNRLQQEIEPPQGQVAIVFTDIVNSTHLWETNPGMPTAIKMHHTFMRRQLRLDGGYEVKTEGDSFMVSFQTVSAALLWAFNCQIGLLQQEWPRELLEAADGKIVYDSEGNLVQRGLRVRMGVHWGSPQCERDPITRRMDYYGPMVNRAARINASADGGQLMASQDVINEIQALRELVDTMDEAELSDMPAEMKREVAELKRIGFEVKDMGERKLKGLEVPEKLHLLYPKSLAGRFEISGDLRANVEVHDARTIVAEPRQIDIDEVRELSKLVLRLEALSATQPTVPGSPAMSPSMEMTPSRRSHTRGVRLLPPTYLGPNIKDEMDDEELSLIIESLTTRLENTLSTLYLKHLGGFSSVLAALEQATRIDPKLIVHALTLMNGQMGQ